MLTGCGTETYTYQTKSPTWPANTGKDSCEMYTHFLCLLLLMHAQYFALLNLSLKLQFCDEASLEFPFNFFGFVSVCLLCSTSGRWSVIVGFVLTIVWADLGTMGPH